jgi:peptide/nickel transport system permease protein
LTTTGKPVSTGRFLLTRVRDGVVVLLLVLVVVFFLSYVVGDPASTMAPTDASPEQIERLREQLGTNRPLTEQAADYFGGIPRGDFGESLWQQRPALDPVREALPATIKLSIAGIIAAAILGTTSGVIAGTRPNGIFDRVANMIAMAGVSVPTFWLGMVLIVVFAVQLGWVPTSGDVGWKSIILPATAIGIEHGGRIFQLVRSGTFDELNKPYVLVARSKGLAGRVVVWKHILRNAAVLILTTIGWEYVRLWGGAIFAVEVVFAWPGIGQLVINAAEREDFPVLQAGVIVAGAFVVLSNLVVDTFYRVVDRRLQVA